MSIHDWTILILATGAMGTITNGIIYYIWRRGPSRVVGFWLALAWTIAMLRGIELRSLDQWGETASLLTWGNVWLATLATSISMWRAAAVAKFTRKKGDTR